MRPFLYYSPDFSIPGFAFMLMMASLVATFVSYKMAPRRGLSQVAVLDLSIVGTIMAVVGGRLFFVFVEARDYYFWDRLSQIYQVWQGGFVSYGAFIGLAIGWTTYLKIRRLDTLRYLDHMCLFAGPFVDFFVRAGCLMAGCCYGKPSPHHKLEYILYIVFNDRSGDAGSKFNGVGLWPVQIYSMVAAILIFLICYAVERRQTFKGQIVLTFLMLYATFRSIIELFRTHIDRQLYFNGTLNAAQIVSFLFLIGCAGLYFYLKKRYPIDRDAQS